MSGSEVACGGAMHNQRSVAPVRPMRQIDKVSSLYSTSLHTLTTVAERLVVTVFSFLSVVCGHVMFAWDDLHDQRTERTQDTYCSQNATTNAPSAASIPLYTEKRPPQTFLLTSFFDLLPAEVMSANNREDRLESLLSNLG